MPQFKNKKRGFTLVEMLVSMTVFTVLVTIGANVYITTARAQRKANLEAAIYNEARAILDKLTREIRHKTVDYDEYYNQMVIANQPNRPNSTQIYYGANFGDYSKNFYSPGLVYVSTLPESTYIGRNQGIQDRNGLGAQCTKASGQLEDCSVSGTRALKKTLDLDTGQNWWDGTQASAFCDEKNIPGSCTKPDLNKVQELYLINPTGTEKTIIALETSSSGDNALAMLKLSGTDTDGNNVADKWICQSDYYCPESGVQIIDPIKQIIPGTNPYKKDLTDNTIDDTFFVPITPNTIKIKDFYFIIAPLDDPRRAFNENEMQVQPHVIISLTIQPSPAFLREYPDSPPEITVRTAVSSRVNSVVTSYAPL